MFSHLVTRQRLFHHDNIFAAINLDPNKLAKWPDVNHALESHVDTVNSIDESVHEDAVVNQDAAVVDAVVKDTLDARRIDGIHETHLGLTHFQNHFASSTRQFFRRFPSLRSRRVSLSRDELSPVNKRYLVFTVFYHMSYFMTLVMT